MGFFENIKSGLITGAALLLLVSAMPAAAQDPQMSGNEAGVAELRDDDSATMDPNLYMGLQDAYQRNMKLRTPSVRPQEIQTLFFTLWQHKLLQEAKRQGASADSMTRDATDSELAAPENRVRGIREISLGGIVYRSTKDWVVWLNSQRITPDAIPKQEWRPV